MTVGSVSPTAVQIQSQNGCKKIRVMENRGVAGWPTTDFLVYKGSVSATPVRIPAGNSYTFDCAEGGGYGFFGVNVIVGWVKAVAGSTTFDQDESAIGI